MSAARGDGTRRSRLMRAHALKAWWGAMLASPPRPAYRLTHARASARAWGHAVKRDTLGTPAPVPLSGAANIRSLSAGASAIAFLRATFTLCEGQSRGFY